MGYKFKARVLPCMPYQTAYCPHARQWGTGALGWNNLPEMPYET